jgi:SAM-dependent methyltransferase
MANDVNADQREFWSGDPGQVWVREQARIDAMHEEAAALLLEAAAPQPGEVIHDIGCGAGTTTLRLARRVGPGGIATGYDISAPLTRAAEAAAQAEGVANARFVLADAQTHPFPPAAAQAVVSRFGVMFFADPVAAFRNMARALAPGGRFVFVCWAGPSENPWFSLPMQVARDVLGGIEASDPHAPGPMAFADTGRVTALLQAAGLQGIEPRKVAITLRPPGGLEGVMSLVQHLGPIPRLLRERQPAPEKVEALMAGVRTRLAEWQTPAGEMAMPAQVIVYTARV